jgi:methionyl aminopeptidase
MVITVEPIRASGRGEVYVDKDGRTVRTADGSPSAHFEHTITITNGKPPLLNSRMG